MKTYIVHQPQSATCDVQDIKQYVSRQNAAILRHDEFPATVFVNIRDLVGDPNVVFSCHICDMLVVAEVLTKLGEDAYGWGSMPFATLTEEQLLLVGWDLREHINFVHVSMVDDSPQEELDEVELEEYDSSSEPEELDE